MLQLDRDHLGRFLPKGKAMSHVKGLSDNMRTRLGALLQAGPKGLQIGSGFRSVEHQRRLWNNALKKYGSVAKARKWVAPPGRSKHNTGQASDIWYNGVRLDKAPPEIRKWVHDNAKQYGLEFPLGNESWHIEVAGARSGKIHPLAQALQRMRSTPREKPTPASPSPDPLAKPEPKERARQLFLASDMARDRPSADTLTPADRAIEQDPLSRALQAPQEAAPELPVAPPAQPLAPQPVPDTAVETQLAGMTPQDPLNAPLGIASPVTPPPAIDPTAPAQPEALSGNRGVAIASLIEALMGGGGSGNANQAPIVPLRTQQNQVTAVPTQQKRVFL